MDNKKLVIIGIILVLILGFVLYFVFQKSNVNEITTFEECANAGYPVLETYPRQCRTDDGKVFVEEIESEIRPVLEFSQSEASCGSQEKPEIRIVSGDEPPEIVFSGRLGTPDPCYKISAELETDGNNLHVIISTSSKLSPDEGCIQCTGAVEYSGKITNLDYPGAYKITIKTKQGEVLGSKEIEI